MNSVSKSQQTTPPPQRSNFREKLWEIVFEAETPTGKFFDISLLCVIALSVLAVILESVSAIKAEYADILIISEWAFTIIFTIEYFMRIWLVRKPIRYIFSFYGIVDLLSCLPSYIALIFSGSSHFAVIRLLRLLRMFRVLKMVSHVRGANIIIKGLMASRAKITVFFFFMLIFAMIAGTLMYITESTEGGNTGFTSIPIGIYYAIISITGVGYGDLTAFTALGKFITSFMVLTGYAVIAVPTGIFVGDLAREVMKADETSDACPGCGVHGHLNDAKYCRKCGEVL